MGGERRVLPGSVFVGRKRERAEIRGRLDEAVSGRARALLIAGEAGIGKTALCEQVADEAVARGASVLWGRCWEGEGAPPYWPWSQAIRSWLKEVSREQAILHLGNGAPLVAQIVSELGDIAGDRHPPASSDHEEARFQLFDAVTTFFRSAARDQPIVLLFEDVHWADRSSLLLLQFFTREIADVPILLVATYRDGEVTRGEPLSDVLTRLRHDRIMARIQLRGLAEHDVRGMVEALRGEPVAEDFVRAVARETEGNPFFVEELLRHLVDEEILVREEGRWVSRLATGQLPLPESLRDVIGRRLERLSPLCRETIRIASVLGRELSLDVLGRVTGRSHGEILEALDPAEAAGLVREIPQSIGRYTFAHGLIRETLYQDLRPLERVRLHGQIGEALESAYAADPSPHLSELAHHFLETLPAGDASRAIDYALRAARLARSQVAWEEAIGLYRRALGVFDVDPSADQRLRCETLLELGEVIQDASGRQQARDTFHRAAQLAERLGEPELFARAALGVSGSFGDFEVYATTAQLEILEKALERLSPGDSALRATVMAQLAAALTFSEVHDRKVALAREALAMARRVGDRRSLAHILYVSQMPTWSPDNLDERLEQAREMVRVAEGAGETRLATLGWSVLVSHLLEAGDIEAVRREERARGRAVRESFGRAMLTVIEAMLALFEGRLDEVEPLAERALELGQGPDSSGILNSYNAQLLFLRREQDRLGEIIDMIRAFLDQFPKILAWRGGLVWGLAELGREDEARAELERFAADGFRGVPREMLWLATIWQLSETAAKLGDRAHCETLYGLLAPYAGRCVTVGPAICLGSASRILGVLAAAIGRFDDAERHFVAGLETDARLGSRPWVAWGQFGLAGVLLERSGRGDRERAARLVGEAGSTARATGMKALERRLEAMAAASGLVADRARPSPGPASPPDVAPQPRQPAILSREGARWTIDWGGRQVRLRHTKGLTYLACLLARPGEEIHALDLLATSGERAPAGGTDALARLRELRADLEEAEALRDVGRAERLTGAIEQLTEEAASERTGPEAERARLGVTKPLKTAIRKIRETHPSLARHLETSIRTGYVCRYAPDPGTPLWKTSG